MRWSSGALFLKPATLAGIELRLMVTSDWAEEREVWSSREAHDVPVGRSPTQKTETQATGPQER